MWSGVAVLWLAMDRLGTILSIWAHPDDETYLAGGIMADAVQRGGRVVCVTATRGELGSPDPQRWPPGPPLAALRTEELAAALAELGITEHHWLDYPDGGCASVDQDEAVGRLAEIMRDVRPDTVLTFGPDGMTGHSDHRAVGGWALAAAEAVGAGPAIVHWATNTPEFAARLQPLMERFDIMMDDIDPPTTQRDKLSIYLSLDGDLLDRKVRALRRQESQIEPLLRDLGPAGLAGFVAEEAFRVATSG